MDTELFQILTLFLLLGLLLTLFGVLQSLGAIRRSLDRGDSGAARAPAATTATDTGAAAAPATAASTDLDDESPRTWARPTEAETAASERSGWPSPQDAVQSAPASTETRDPEPQPEPAAQEETPTARDAGARVLYGDTGLTTATPNEAALRPSESEAAEPAANPFETSPEPSREEPAAVQEDPQEQPFERDGRWWFRRGDELLVYEEQTGQWVAAPQAEPSTSGSVAASSDAGGSASGSPASTGGSAGGQVTTQVEQAASFWKCPSCGAVNGSTATSCRMCFTARP